MSAGWQREIDCQKSPKQGANIDLLTGLLAGGTAKVGRFFLCANNGVVEDLVLCPWGSFKQWNKKGST